MNTVALKQETFHMLREVKERTDADSFDEVIRKLLLKAKKPAVSLCGEAKHTPEFEREELDRFA